MTQRSFVAYRRAYRWVFSTGFFLLGLAAALFAFLAVVNDSEATASRQTAQSAQQRADESNEQLRSSGEQIAKLEICQRTDAGSLAEFGFVCEQARKVASQSQPSPVDTQALAKAITTLVGASLPAQVEAAVQRYMQAHPTASLEEVREWVKQEVAAHPATPGADGQPGKDGAAGQPGEAGPPGPPPTDAQIDAAVGRWLEAHPVNGCPAPAQWEPTLFTDGRSGYRCLIPETMPTE